MIWSLSLTNKQTSLRSCNVLSNLYICCKVRSNEQAGPSIEMFFVKELVSKAPLCLLPRYLAMLARQMVAGRFPHMQYPYWRSFRHDFHMHLSAFVTTPRRTNTMRKTSFLTLRGEYMHHLYSRSINCFWSPFSFISWPPYLPTSALSPYLQWRNGWNSCQQMT